MKHLVFDMRNCSGCQLCMLACSFHKSGILGLASSRIFISTAFITSLGSTKIGICKHCTRPRCMDACEVGAIMKDPGTGLVSVDKSLCVGCMECIKACPFGGASWDPVNEIISMCDQCGECIKWCSSNAIKFVDRPELIREKTAREVGSDVKKEEEKWPAMPEDMPEYEMVRKALRGYFASKGVDMSYTEEPSALPPSRKAKA